MAARTAENEAIEKRIEDAVFELMETRNIPNIKVSDVIRLAGVSRSTFYRHFDNVDQVVKLFEANLLDVMRSINRSALKARFDKNELKPTVTMISRMETLHGFRSKILVLNGPHGDPQFEHKATVFMHEYLSNRLRTVPGTSLDQEFYLSFIIAGHHNLVHYWLEKHPEVEPERIATLLNRLYYATFFLDDADLQNPWTAER